METEKTIERYLCSKIKEIGGEAYKFTSPQRKFVLDRLCVLPKGKICFVEVKSPGQTPSAGQFREIERLLAKGHMAAWVASKTGVDELINQIKGELRCK